MPSQTLGQAARRFYCAVYHCFQHLEHNPRPHHNPARLYRLLSSSQQNSLRFHKVIAKDGPLKHHRVHRPRTLDDQIVATREVGGEGHHIPSRGEKETDQDEQTVSGTSVYEQWRRGPVQSSIERPFLSLGPWEHAIRFRTETTVVLEYAVPAKSIRPIQSALNSRLNRKRGLSAVVELGTSITTEVGAEGLRPVLIAGPYGQVVEAVRVLTRHSHNVLSVQKASQGTQPVHHDPSSPQLDPKVDGQGLSCKSAPLLAQTERPTSALKPFEFVMRVKNEADGMLEIAVPEAAWQNLASHGMGADHMRKFSGAALTIGGVHYYNTSDTLADGVTAAATEASKQLRSITVHGMYEQLEKVRSVLTGPDVTSYPGDTTVNFKRETIRIPADVVGFIRSRNGNLLRGLQRHGRIYSIRILNSESPVAETLPHEVLVELSGLTFQVTRATNLIEKLIERVRKRVRMGEGGHRRSVTLRIPDPDSRGSLQQQLRASYRFEMKKIEAQTGAKIGLDLRYDQEKGEALRTRDLELSGTKWQIEAAKAYIKELVDNWCREHGFPSTPIDVVEPQAIHPSGSGGLAEESTDRLQNDVEGLQDVNDHILADSDNQQLPASTPRSTIHSSALDPVQSAKGVTSSDAQPQQIQSRARSTITEHDPTMSLQSTLHAESTVPPDSAISAGASALADTLRPVLRTLTHSVVLITTRDLSTRSIESCRGITVSSFSTVTLHPPTISFNIKLPSRTWDAMRASGRFCAHILAASPQGAAIADAFTKRYENPSQPFVDLRRAGFKIVFRESRPAFIHPAHMTGVVLACIFARVQENLCVIVGDHVLVVATVETLKTPQELTVSHIFDTAEALTYGRRKYRSGGRDLEVADLSSLGLRNQGTVGDQTSVNQVEMDEEHAEEDDTIEFEQAVAPPSDLFEVDDSTMRRINLAETPDDGLRKAGQAAAAKLSNMSYDLEELSPEAAAIAYFKDAAQFDDGAEDATQMPHVDDSHNSLSEEQDESGAGDSGAQNPSMRSQEYGDATADLETEAIADHLAQEEDGSALRQVDSVKRTDPNDTPQWHAPNSAPPPSFSLPSQSSQKIAMPVFMPGSSSADHNDARNASRNAWGLSGTHREYSTFAHRLLRFNHRRNATTAAEPSTSMNWMSKITDLSLLSQTVASFLGLPTPTPSSPFPPPAPRMNAAMRWRRESHKASLQLRHHLRNGTLMPEQSLALERSVSRNERAVARRLAHIAAIDLKRMLDEGTVDVPRAQWMERAVEQGQVAVVMEAKEVRHMFDNGQVAQAAFARVAKALEAEHRELSEQAMRLRGMVDEDEDLTVREPSAVETRDQARE